jgi:hypothetical protein
LELYYGVSDFWDGISLFSKFVLVFGEGLSYGFVVDGKIGERSVQIQDMSCEYLHDVRFPRETAMFWCRRRKAVAAS